MESHAMSQLERRSLIGFAKLYVLENKKPEPDSPAAEPEPEAETAAQAAAPSAQLSDTDPGAIAATQS